ncbi:unnamed protein product, partial [Didymodactylos carnosus]
MSSRENVTAVELDRQLDQFIDTLIEKNKADPQPPTEINDDWWNDLQRHPFFLKEMPEDGSELHPAVEALQALKWDDVDDTPKEKAEKFKEDGNYMFQLKKYKNSIISYTEGIKIRCTDSQLNAILFCNRASANYHLGNYRSALRDCVLSRKCKSDHIKAFVKGAEACMKLQMYKDVQSWCTAALLKEQERDERKRLVRDRKKKTEEEKILNAIKNRSIHLQTDPSIDIFDPNSSPLGSSIKLNDEDDTLIFPVVILYPEYSQTDYVKEFH